MPREGSGQSDNAVETGENIIHGAGKEEVRLVDSMLLHLTLVF